MAIYHLSVQRLSRGKGKNVVAAAAYRSGERLTDEKTGLTKSYKRDVTPESFIMAPANSPDWITDRQRLWNEIEKIEKRKDAFLAREMNVALPRELTKEQQRELVKGFVQEQIVKRGMVADVAIHRDDANNPHFHVMMTTRHITENGFSKKNDDWKKKELVEEWRKEWSNYANRALERAGIDERITHLSHEARGLEQLPTKHLGYEANSLEKKGIHTEIGDLNREIKEVNAQIIDLQQAKERIQKQKQEQQREEKAWQHFAPVEKAAIKKATQHIKGYVTHDKIIERIRGVDAWSKKLDAQHKEIKQTFDRMSTVNAYCTKHTDLEEKLNGLGLLAFKEKKLTRNALAATETTIQKYNFTSAAEAKQQVPDKLERCKLELQDVENKQKVARSTRNDLLEAKRAFENKEKRVLKAHYPDLQNAIEKIPSDKLKQWTDVNEAAGKPIIVSKETGKFERPQFKDNSLAISVNDIFSVLENSLQQAIRENERRERERTRSQSKGRTRSRSIGRNF